MAPDISLPFFGVKVFSFDFLKDTDGCFFHFLSAALKVSRHY